MSTRKTATPKAIQSLADLTPDPQNARAHNERNVGAITTALQEVGAARSIVIDEHGVVLAGNATIRAAAAAGLTKVQVVDADGETIIAVRRSGLSARLKTRLALADNRAAELATWDVEMLAQLADADPAALAGLWTAEELELLLTPAPPVRLADPDDLPPERSTDIRLGDVFELGGHRLLCGSSIVATDVERVLAGAKPALMVTDPPYGVEYDPEWRRKTFLNNTKRVGKVTNDDRADWTEAWRLFPGDVAYVWHAANRTQEVHASLTSVEYQIRAQIIWNKSQLVIGRGHYHWKHEPCWYAVRKGRTASWAGDRKQCTVWDIAVKDNASGETTHGTQKPVECMARPMRNHEAREVYEPFCGSGSALIAADTLGKRCYAIELEPTYVQQAIDRWEAFTGGKAVKR